MKKPNAPEAAHNPEYDDNKGTSAVTPPQKSIQTAYTVLASTHFQSPAQPRRIYQNKINAYYIYISNY